MHIPWQFYVHSTFILGTVHTGTLPSPLFIMFIVKYGSANAKTNNHDKPPLNWKPFGILTHICCTLFICSRVLFPLVDGTWRFKYLISYTNILVHFWPSISTKKTHAHFCKTVSIMHSLVWISIVIIFICWLSWNQINLKINHNGLLLVSVIVLL